MSTTAQNGEVAAEEPYDQEQGPETSPSRPTKVRSKRTVVVVRRENNAAMSPPLSSGRNKKTVLVARKPRLSEVGMFPPVGAVASSSSKKSESEFTPSGIKFDAEGRPLGHTVLGSVDDFELQHSMYGHPAISRGGEDGDGGLNDDWAPSSSAKTPTSWHQDNMSSTRQSASLGRTIGTPLGGDRPFTSGTSADERDRRRYFSRLAAAEESASKARAARADLEASLLSRMSSDPSGAMTLGREARALERWKDQKRRWDSIQTSLSNKLGRGPETLVMTTAQEYRERSEAYQLLMDATPAMEKFSSYIYWEMTLRGLGERATPVGNLFSGLFCDQTQEPGRFKTVRRPSNTRPDVTRNRSWRDSIYLKKRRRQLAGNIAKLEPVPRELEAHETGGLLVRAVPLLEWATISSKIYFEDEEAIKVEQGAVALATAAGAAGTATKAPGQDVTLQDPKKLLGGPSLEVHGPLYSLLEVKAGLGDSSTATLTLMNSGSTVLFYEWSRVDKENIQPADIGAGPLHRFHCHNPTGTLLPHDKLSVCFTFTSTDPGLFYDEWKLTSTPPAEMAIVQKDTGDSTTRSHSKVLHIHLRGAAHADDRKGHCRALVEKATQRAIMSAKVEEIVIDVIHAVRTPPRQTEARRRQRLAFDSANAALAPFFTPALYDALANVLYRARTAANVAADSQEQEGLGTDVTDTGGGDGMNTVNDGEAAESSADNDINETAVAESMLKALNDGVWDGSFKTVEAAIDALDQYIPKPQEITPVEKPAEKDPAAEEGDNVEDEETEDPEEPEEEEVKFTWRRPPPPPPLHPLAQLQNTLRAEYRQLMLESLITPCPSPLPGALSAMTSFGAGVAGALVAAEGAVPLPGNFVFPKGDKAVCRFTQEAQAAWAIVDTAVGSADPIAASKALATGKTANPAAAFRIQACAGIKPIIASAVQALENALWDAEGSSAADKDAILRYSALEALEHRSIATVRSTDVRGKRVILHAQDVIEGNETEGIKAMAEEVRSLLVHEPSVISIILEIGLPVCIMAAKLSALINTEVTPCTSVPEMADIMKSVQTRVHSMSDNIQEKEENVIGVRVLIASPLSDKCALPPPPSVVEIQSDDEAERVPDFYWGNPPPPPPPPTKLDVNLALEGTSDVIVAADSLSIVQPKRHFLDQSKSKVPVLAGLALHEDLTAVSMIIGQGRRRPLLTVLGGGAIEPRLRLLDALIDISDEIALVGGAGLAALACIGKSIRHLDLPEVLPIMKKLLGKAKRRGVNIILPQDYVVGDVPEILESETIITEPNDAASANTPGGEEEEDPAAGTEYVGETNDTTVQSGIPAGGYPLDIGPITSAALKSAVLRCETILWHGMVGVCESSAFQSGTRGLLDVVMSAHSATDGRKGPPPLVVLAGTSLTDWTKKIFTSNNEGMELGFGEGVAHLCSNAPLCQRLIEGRPIPRMHTLTQRVPVPREELLRASALAYDEAEAEARAAEEEARAEQDDEE